MLHKSILNKFKKVVHLFQELDHIQYQRFIKCVIFFFFKGKSAHLKYTQVWDTTSKIDLLL